MCLLKIRQEVSKKRLFKKKLMIMNCDIEIMLTRFCLCDKTPEKNEKGKYLLLQIVLGISWLLGFINSGSMARQNIKTKACQNCSSLDSWEEKREGAKGGGREGGRETRREGEKEGEERKMGGRRTETIMRRREKQKERARIKYPLWSYTFQWFTSSD